MDGGGCRFAVWTRKVRARIGGREESKSWTETTPERQAVEWRQRGSLATVTTVGDGPTWTAHRWIRLAGGEGVSSEKKTINLGIRPASRCLGRHRHRRAVSPYRATISSDVRKRMKIHVGVSYQRQDTSGNTEKVPKNEQRK